MLPRLTHWKTNSSRLELRELTGLGIGLIPLTAALDLTTPTGRAIAGMLALFAEFGRDILSERVLVCIARARKEGLPTAGRERRR